MPTELFAPELLDCWSADNIRFTAFPDAKAKIDSQEWWSKLLGQPPQSRTERPMEATIEETGNYSRGLLKLTVSPGRIDLLVAPSPPDTAKSDASMPNLGPFIDMLTTFNQLVEKWFQLETCPPIARLAFGATLSQSAKDRVAAYQKLASYLPCIRIDPEGSSEFLYRINRPNQAKTPAIDGLRINRLSTWHAIRWQVFLSQILPQPSRAPTSVELSHAVQLQLDINTDQAWSTILSPETLSPLWLELTELAKEIAARGDQP
jgi:hypothetical protein